MFKPTEKQIKAFEELAVLANTFDRNNVKEVKAAFKATDKFMKEHKQFWTWINSTDEGWKFMTDVSVRVRAELGLSNEHTN